MSNVTVELIHDKKKGKIRYPDALDEFTKAAKAHADQARFTKTVKTLKSSKTKRRLPTIYVNGTALSGDVKAVEIESAILNADSSLEPRLADIGSEDNSSDTEELEDRVSKLETRLDENAEQLANISDSIEAVDDKTDQMIEHFTELNREVLERLDDINKKLESSGEKPDQIRNPRE